MKRMCEDEFIDMIRRIIEESGTDTCVAVMAMRKLADEIAPLEPDDFSLYRNVYDEEEE